MAIEDRFRDMYLDPLRAGNPHWPYTRSAVVTPDDSAQLSFATRALYVGSAGDVVVTMLDGKGVEAASDTTFNNVPPGAELRVRCSRVKATGTTATQIVALD